MRLLEGIAFEVFDSDFGPFSEAEVEFHVERKCSFVCKDVHWDGQFHVGLLLVREELEIESEGIGNLRLRDWNLVWLRKLVVVTYCRFCRQT